MLYNLEIKRIFEIARLFQSVKPIIVFSEEEDPELKANLQVYKELRDAFDHLMRYLLSIGEEAVISTTPNESRTIVLDQLDSAYAHVYRACFDALEGALLSIRYKISEELKPYSYAVIQSVLPEYPEFKQKLSDVNQEIARVRMDKDIGTKSLDKAETAIILQEELYRFYRKVQANLDTLERHKKELTSAKWKDHAAKAAIGLGVAAVAGVVGYYLKNPV